MAKEEDGPTQPINYSTPNGAAQNPNNTPTLPVKKVFGLSNKELGLYLASMIGVGLFFFFFTPGIPDEIGAEIAIAVIAILRNHYLSKK